MRTVPLDTLRKCLHLLPADNPRVVASGNHAVPWQLVTATDLAFERYRLFMLNAPVGIPTRDGVTLETPFVGTGMRRQPGLAYYPSRLSLVPALLKQRLRPDILLLHVAPPRSGMLSLGVEVNILPAAIEAVRAHGGVVIAQVNRNMPYTYGDALIPVEDVDFAVEVDDALGELRAPEISDVQRVIGAHVASLVPENATLQLGIGAIPDATLESLGRHRDLRIWSEMVSDGVLHLEKRGALGDEPISTSFAAGSQELYDWLDDNRRVVFCRTERANDPAVIARQPRMTSINAALQVDLFVQANASYVHGHIHSGFGGQTDFIVGALHAADGHAIIALPSWHPGTDSSTIIDRLPCPATSFQHSYVVTEQGIATVWGRPQREQAAEIIEHAAAPAARDQLRTRAAQMF